MILVALLGRRKVDATIDTRRRLLGHIVVSLWSLQLLTCRRLEAHIRRWRLATFAEFSDKGATAAAKTATVIAVLANLVVVISVSINIVLLLRG